MVADKFAGRLLAEPPIVALGRYHRELLDDVPGEVSCLNLLTSNVVETEAVEIGKHLRRTFGIELGSGWDKDRQRVSTPNLRNYGGKP